MQKDAVLPGAITGATAKQKRESDVGAADALGTDRDPIGPIAERVVPADPFPFRDDILLARLIFAVKIKKEDVRLRVFGESRENFFRIVVIIADIVIRKQANIRIGAHPDVVPV